MKTSVKLFALSVLVLFTGCKGMDLVFDFDPFKRQVGTVRLSPANDPPANADCEVCLKIKRNGAACGSEDVEVNVRMPATRQPEKKAEEKRDILPIPQLLTAAK